MRVRLAHLLEGVAHPRVVDVGAGLVLEGPETDAGVGPKGPDHGQLLIELVAVEKIKFHRFSVPFHLHAGLRGLLFRGLEGQHAATGFAVTQEPDTVKSIEHDGLGHVTVVLKGIKAHGFHRRNLASCRRLVGENTVRSPEAP